MTIVTERPGIAPGYGIDTGREGLLDWAWAEQRLTESRNYWIITTRPDGRPHAAPVWGVYALGAVHFGAEPASVKARNLAANPAVVVHLESGDETVILEGRITRGVRDDDFEAVDDEYARKYEDPTTGEAFHLDPATAAGLWVLRPEVALGWLETDYPRTATRWRFSNG